MHCTSQYSQYRPCGMNLRVPHYRCPNQSHSRTTAATSDPPKVPKIQATFPSMLLAQAESCEGSPLVGRLGLQNCRIAELQYGRQRGAEVESMYGVLYECKVLLSVRRRLGVSTEYSQRIALSTDHLLGVRFLRAQRGPGVWGLAPMKERRKCLASAIRILVQYICIYISVQEIQAKRFKSCRIPAT
jgi:hypothetical protein